MLGSEESNNVITSDSAPTHVNLAVSSKTVTYGKIQHIKVKATDDNGKILKNVRVIFKIYKGSKLVATQDEFSTGGDGCVYYCTDSLNAEKYSVKYGLLTITHTGQVLQLQS